MTRLVNSNVTDLGYMRHFSYWYLANLTVPLIKSVLLQLTYSLFYGEK